MCKWLKDEICVNGDCPAVADFCPVVNHPGVCRYEEMDENKIECWQCQYIDKETFKKSVEERYCKPCKAEGKDYNGCLCRACWVDDMLDEVECFKTADVAPVAHGRWEVSTDEWFETDVYTCSKCRESYVLVEGTPKENLWHYCPNCGAKMDIKDGGNNDAESID